VPRPDPSSVSRHSLPGVDPVSSAVFGAFMRTTHAHRQLMGRKMSVHGVHPAQMFCLSEIAHNDGITQRDLAEKLRVARPTLTVMLQKMEKAGLIERLADESDQRFTRIHLSATGQSMHEAMHAIMAEVITEMTSGLSESDGRELTRLLGLLGDSIDAALAEPEAST
jgi:MarR family transcriptional regulator, organic hydroperoxide resistance regulator